MENSILNQIPFDPAYIIAGLLILVVLLLILTITTMTKVRRLDRQYDYFMRGKDAETLEDVILDQIEAVSYTHLDVYKRQYLFCWCILQENSERV